MYSHIYITRYTILKVLFSYKYEIFGGIVPSSMTSPTMYRAHVSPRSVQSQVHSLRSNIYSWMGWRVVVLLVSEVYHDSFLVFYRFQRKNINFCSLFLRLQSVRLSLRLLVAKSTLDIFIKLGVCIKGSARLIQNLLIICCFFFRLHVHQSVHSQKCVPFIILKCSRSCDHLKTDTVFQPKSLANKSTHTTR